MPPECEYCELIIYSKVEEFGSLNRRAFIKYASDTVPQPVPQSTKALRRLRHARWSVYFVTSTTHADGTLQRHLYLKRTKAYGK